MTDAMEKSSQGNVLIGVVLIALSLIPILASFDVAPFSSKDINGPWWVGMLAGVIMLAAGLAVLVDESASVFRGVMALVMSGGIVVLLFWGALGASEHMCEGNSYIMLFFSSIDADYADLPCRITFGIGAVLFDAVFIFFVVLFMQQVLGERPWLVRARKVAEGLIVGLLSPLFLVLLLVGLISAFPKKLAARQVKSDETRE